MYNPIVNHWATLINNKLYDITGEIDAIGYQKWDEYDISSHRKNLIKHCFYKQYNEGDFLNYE